MAPLVEGAALQPSRDRYGTLVDLLDRLLDKGMILNVDMIIGVADIPLIGISLRAALAAVETMLEHGLLVDWDTRIREHAMGVQGQNEKMRSGRVTDGHPVERRQFETGVAGSGGSSGGNHSGGIGSPGAAADGVRSA